MYNFVTGEIEDTPSYETDEQAKQYIPQNVACQGLYDLYRAKGESIIDALEHVFKTYVAILES